MGTRHPVPVKYTELFLPSAAPRASHVVAAGDAWEGRLTRTLLLVVFWRAALVVGIGNLKQFTIITSLNKWLMPKAIHFGHNRV